MRLSLLTKLHSVLVVCLFILNIHITLLKKHRGQTLTETSGHCQASPRTLPKPHILTTSCFTGTLRTRAGSGRRGFPQGPSCSLDGAEHQAGVALNDRRSCPLLKKCAQQRSWPGQDDRAALPRVRPGAPSPHR